MITLTKTRIDLNDQLSYKPENAWLKISPAEAEEVMKYSVSYKNFLNTAKTEREAIEWAEAEAKKNGFISLDDVVIHNRRVRPGDRLYAKNRDKNIILCVVGVIPPVNGINIIGSHVDAPRIDIKPCPLYEDSGLAFLKTHYYGGIKKYQWVAMPLVLHGVVYKSSGEKITVNIGDGEDESKLCISDLLPHLAQEQMQKKMSEGVSGESLNVLSGSIPLREDDTKEKIKTNMLRLLNARYGITEEDFLRAELELLPAFHACDIGLDGSMIGGYGQDDRVCAYTSMQAILETKTPRRTALCVLIDKEEIGSEGNTGIQSAFMVNTIAKLCASSSDNYTDIMLRDALFNSKCLSADVTAAFDPTYEDVNDKRNSAYLGKGVVVVKYSGSRGKAGASDANAEFVAEITNLLNQHQVVWQSGELGKVDMGGGGTIAMFVAKYGMDVLDVGPCILSMHSPFEVASKADIYMTYKAYKAFYAS